jgi:2-polyprenyl-3-methyl-5-hydroxy-6-metoxy-1,4-benzoquinol methylase
MTDEWIRLAQVGPHRIHFIMPFTFKQLGDVSGKIILDLGCGEGEYSRELARRGAMVTAVDCAENVIKYCVNKSIKEQLKVTYVLGNYAVFLIN